MRLRRTIDMRYAGQWRQLSIEMPPGRGVETALAHFHAEHERAFAFRDEARPVEVYAARVVAEGVVPKPQSAGTKAVHDAVELPKPAARRPVYFSERSAYVETPVYKRDTLVAGARLAGPAVVEQLDSTVVLPPGTAEFRHTRSSYRHAVRGRFAMNAPVPHSAPALDRVTFEVLKNAFVNLVDQMSEQLLRTCYSFVIYCRDFSNCLCDANGDTVMQGSADIAVHVGTLHLTAKAVIERFRGDINPGDVFLINDPYRGGTHFCDVRVVRPVFVDGRLIAFTQSNGHWADVGGSVPGSFDIKATEHFGEGLRIPPIRMWQRGEFLKDIAEMIVSNTRAPSDAMGDLLAQASCTAMGETRLLELVDRYGVETILSAFRECQDYVERYARNKVSNLPEGTWRTRDFIDQDPSTGRGVDPDRGGDDDQGRHSSLRSDRQPPGDRLLPQRRRRQRIQRDGGGHEDVLP